ncbi:unnamed protein product, partial [Linum tenue]
LPAVLSFVGAELTSSLHQRTMLLCFLPQISVFSHSRFASSPLLARTVLTGRFLHTATSGSTSMKHVVLSKLTWNDKAPTLKLRLLYTWKAGNPARPDGFFEFSTLWTDELGVLVQGISLKQLASHLQEILHVGKVYFVEQFAQRESRRRRAPCSNDRLLYFNSNTSFTTSPEDDPTFCRDSFEFRSFEDLEDIASRHVCLVGLSPILSFIKASLSITLRSEFAEKLNVAHLMELDGAAPVIIAFTSLSLSIWRGNVGASNTTATRIVMSPAVPQCAALTVHFGDVVPAIGILPAECDTPEKAVTVYRESFRMITELQAVRSTATLVCFSYADRLGMLIMSYHSQMSLVVC